MFSLDVLYGGDFRYFRYLHSHVGINFDQWNGERLADLLAKITPQTRVVWLETPSNPTMKELDIAEIATAVHKKNSQILVIVDNTFYTPVYLRPLELGADVVVHSATKYLSGHNDLLGGILVCKNQELAERYFEYYITTGDTLDSFDSWLLLRSLKTLDVRVRQHTKNAQAVVKYLKQDPRVEKVLYPGKGGMISFYLKAEDDVARLLDNVKLITFSESLGGIESLITIPYYQTHADVELDQRQRLGITPRLLRLSVGLENPQDLINDIKQAFVNVGIGPEKHSKIISEVEKRITAYHEAGHAILFHVLPDVGPVYTVSIIPTGSGAAGYTMPLPEKDEMFNTKGKMLQDITVSLGGRVAEELIFDDVTTGASQDIKQATATAKDMVTKYGFSDDIGMINYADEDEVFIGRDFGHTSRGYSEDVAKTIDHEVKKIIDEAYTKAKQILEDHMDILHSCAALLMEKERIDRKVFEALFGEDTQEPAEGEALIEEKLSEEDVQE